MAESTSRAKQVFVAHLDQLQKAITNPVPLASSLTTKKLISEATNSDVVSTPGVPSSTKAGWILEDLKAGLGAGSEADAEFLKVFCQVLETSGVPALVRIAASMKSSLIDTHGNTSGELISASKAKEKVELLRCEFVEDEFIQLRGDYMNTLDAIQSIIGENVSLEKLKQRVRRQYTSLEEELEHAHTVDKVMCLFRKKYDTFPRIVELRGLVHGLHLYEAIKEIDKFNEKRMEVYKTILAKHFPKIEPNACSQSQNVQVRFVTSWNPEMTTVHHFEQFLKNFFTSTEQEITLVEVCKSSLVFVCSTPLSATSAIIRIVKKKEQLLPQLGVISITVGDHVAFKDDNKAADKGTLALMSPTEMLSRMLSSKVAEHSEATDSSKAVEHSEATDSEVEQEWLQDDDTSDVELAKLMDFN